jgi:hypothetical protein
MMKMFPFITPNMDTAIELAALILIVQIIAYRVISTESMLPEIFKMMWITPLPMPIVRWSSTSSPCVWRLRDLPVHV